MVTKPDGTLHFCVDFLKLNTETIADCHPIGRIDDFLDSLGNARAKYFYLESCTKLETSEVILGT